MRATTVLLGTLWMGCLLVAVACFLAFTLVEDALEAQP
jgi:hypothetical protein